MSVITPIRAKPPLILALDIGTSSIRAAIFDRLGRAVEGTEVRQGHEIRTGADGSSETDPDALLETLWDCLDRLLAQSGPLSEKIAAVATCTFVSNILGVDKNGQAITPLTTYADTRADAEVAGLRADFDDSVVHDRTGCHFHPSYLPARFRWLARVRPELFPQVARWVSIGEYLELKIFSEAAVSYSVASWTGLLDRQKMVWDEPLLDGLPVEKGQLSPLTDINLPRRGLSPEFADRWPALKEVPWFPAVGDGAAANIGSGCVSPRRVALTVGTSSALRVIVTLPIRRVPAGLWCYRVDGRRLLLGGALSEGGSVFAWMKGTLRLGDSAKWEPALASLEPDGHGLTVLPFLAGERSPGWAGYARGTIHGLSLATTPVDILRAGLEAVAYRIALVFQLLSQWLPENPQVIASGGALIHSPAWLQIITDVLGRPVAVSEVQEVSARGAALLALEALGALADWEQVPDFLSSVCQPDPARHARYRQGIERQQALYNRLVQGK